MGGREGRKRGEEGRGGGKGCMWGGRIMGEGKEG